MMKKKAFTLVEMMITISVMSILMAMAVFVVKDITRRVYVKQAKTELEMIATAISQLAWDTGQWPNRTVRNNAGSAEAWDLTPSYTGLLGNNGSFTGWDGPYIDKIPADPWGNPYFFDPDYTIDHAVRIVVGSFGPNGSGRNRYDADDIVIRLDD
ncbi:MAG: type II secretion system protein GspG [Kiritimatiellales bacterium]|nr:type II secretion system protein GspG [Kiritimatiellales bacterium]